MKSTQIAWFWLLFRTQFGFFANVKMKYTQHKNNTVLIHRQSLTHQMAWSWSQFDRCTRYWNLITICGDEIYVIFSLNLTKKLIAFWAYNNFSGKNTKKFLSYQQLKIIVIFILSHCELTERFSSVRFTFVYVRQWLSVNAPTRSYISKRQLTTRPFSPWLFTVYYLHLVS